MILGNKLLWFYFVAVFLCPFFKHLGIIFTSQGLFHTHMPMEQI